MKSDLSSYSACSTENIHVMEAVRTYLHNAYKSLDNKVEMVSFYARGLRKGNWGLIHIYFNMVVFHFIRYLKEPVREILTLITCT